MFGFNLYKAEEDIQYLVWIQIGQKRIYNIWFGFRLGRRGYTIFGLDLDWAEEDLQYLVWIQIGQKRIYNIWFGFRLGRRGFTIFGLDLDWAEEGGGGGSHRHQQLF